MEIDTNQFYARNLDEKNYKTFESAPYIKVENFVASSMIQYNRQKRHFRCLKFLGRNKVKILDGEEIRIIEGEGEKKKLVQDKDWVNYVTSFKSFRQINKPERDGNDMIATIDGYERKVVGGELWVTQWNVQSLRHKETIKEYIRNIDADFVCLNETRTELTMSGYASFSSK